MTEMNATEATEKKSLNFIEQAVENDLREGKNGGKVQTRFPPEPNGYLHIGHAKAICLDFGIAARYGGVCNLRFDDTNPTKEDMEYVEAIKEDIQWLGFQWGNEYYASDYFQQLWDFAVNLIKEGKAYIDEQNSEQIAAQKGTPTQPGTESPYRNRPIEESLELFNKMNSGEIEEGKMVLRAKIDMASPNMHFRDPIIYRVVKTPHHRTGETWKAYPMYDFAHGQSDYFEGVTHSLCTLEFVNNRELYNWVLETLNVYHPEQTEFARLNLTYTVLSKRKLIQLVKEGYVKGWDDPRMPTLSALRRRGVPPEAIHDFCRRIGMAKSEAVVEYGLLEFCIREYLNAHAPRWMAVLNPVRLVIDNYPEDQEDVFEMPLYPDDDSFGSRKVPFTRELYIDRDDFRLDPPKKYYRLAPGQEVRLRYAYFVTCTDVVKDAEGNVQEIHCTYDPASRGGNSPDGRKVKGTIHWVSAKYALPAEVRLYEQLFSVADPNNVPEGKTFLDYINPDSLRTVSARLEPAMAQIRTGETVQFERVGYFCKDRDSTDELPVFNRTVTLRDTWAKIEKKGAK